MITVDRLSRRYGDFKAVEDVSFHIGPGEVVGLLGHNGAGKTTIMKILTGFLEPSAGHIRLDGLDPEQSSQEVRRQIGYLPENCPVYPEMEVVDYLEFQAALHGVEEKARPAAIRRAIARTALEAKALAPIATLSRGYRQRVGVAQAILHQPKVLILDEPTNGLDPSQIQHMRELIRELAQSATILLSTHILQEVQAVCDRVLILRAGRLVLDARLAELAATRHLGLTTNLPPDRLQSQLGQLPGVATVEHRSPWGSPSSHHRYRLMAPHLNIDELADQAARTVMEAGGALYGLQGEIRDLETVFGEVNQGVFHA